jgi:hypothetical protein
MSDREFVALVTIKKTGNESAKQIKENLNSIIAANYNDSTINDVKEFEKEKIPRGYKYNLIETA